jgi:CheY-like chemotaxis protein
VKRCRSHFPHAGWAGYAANIAMKTILVVEDNPDNMALIEQILEDEGFCVLKAILARDGIALLKEEPVDLILMDLSLPEMGGLEATGIIKAEQATKNIPVIALTAHAMKTDRETALSAGCDGYLTKPINEEELLETINKHLPKMDER